MIQWLLEKTARLAQYGQGIGAAGRPGARADKSVLRRVKRAGEKPLVIFDVGANRGDYVQLALVQFANQPLMIHAFEPSAAAFAELSRRWAARNEVVLSNTALGSEAGERTLYCDVAGSELGSLYQRLIEHHDLHLTSRELVRVETLDAYCAAHGIERIHLLKLDVEGHELEVLRGAGRMLEQKRIAMVSFEFGGANVDARTFLRDFFQFFAARQMQLARVNPLGGLHPIPRYHEGLEQFRTTTFVASMTPVRVG
jgi:FkbM family methyltransferase